MSGYRDITVNEFKEKMQQEDAVVLDVRTPDEVEEGVIDGYKLMNLYSKEFIDEIQDLPKDKTYLIYCRSGNRSGMACGVMAQMGFKSLFNLEGGIMAWNYMHSQKLV